MSGPGGRLTLPDGRTLAYDDPDPQRRHAAVLFHGAPGSRLFRPDPRVAAALDVRVITFDRPGYGGSSPVEEPSVLGVAGDVAALLDHLGFGVGGGVGDAVAGRGAGGGADVGSGVGSGGGRVGLVAWSGGCPSAAASAYLLGPSRVARLVLVSGPGPLDEVPGGWEALGEYRRPTAEMARVEPARSVRAVGRHMAPFLEAPESFLGRGSGPDGEVLRGPHRPMLVAQIHEALAQGATGIAADLVAMWLPYGFTLSEVAVPTTVFHGARDGANHADTATYARAIPGATHVLWPEAGHLGILPHWNDVLSAALP